MVSSARFTTVFGVVLVVLLGAVVCACAQEAVPREDLGRDVKLRVFVDKVIGAGGEGGLGWGEQAVIETAEAGFNVFSPRIGGEDMDRVRQMTQWCADHGMYHVPWLRGTLAAPDGPEADGKRVVWRNGGEQPLWSVNSDEFWRWTTDLVLQYAEISAEMPHLMGVFLDYENYAPGPRGGWMLYDLMYDDVIMERFADANDLELPELALDARAGWLEEQDLHEAFEEFQIASWRERCRELREAVDRHNPQFQFLMYPSVGSRFMREAAYPEWSTEAAPIIITTPHTYGRPGAFLPQPEALEANRAIVMQELEVPRELGIPFLYLGGIDPVVRGADPEFSGRNALMMSEVSDGYWVFYEGPVYTEPSHAAYMRWFTWANRAMDEGRFEAWREPRETQEEWLEQLLGPLGAGGAELTLPEVTGEHEQFPRLRMRRDNVMLLAAEAGRPVAITMRHFSLGSQPIALRWEARDRDLVSIASGAVSPGTEAQITFTPQTDGLHIVTLTAGGSAYAVVGANVPLGLSAVQGLRLIFLNDEDRAARIPLHFHVPEGLEEFTITIAGEGPETVRVDVQSPGGDVAATGQSTLAQTRIDVPVTVAGHGAGVWSVVIREAEEGTLEDTWIRLDPRVSPVISLTPEAVFSIER
ncbi:MAG: hypothetical protein ACOX9R_03205 [Armatimonadota bacterium]|jgi:hypothetical protein